MYYVVKFPLSTRLSSLRSGGENKLVERGSGGVREPLRTRRAQKRWEMLTFVSMTIKIQYELEILTFVSMTFKFNTS